MSTPASDLAALRRAAAPAAEGPAPAASGRRHNPIAILGLVALLLLAAFLGLTWQRWMPLPELRVARVATLDAAADATAAPGARPATGPGPVVFQAAGWVEPAPLPVHASALVPGVVSEVLVLEGERVAAGQVLARLDDGDFRLALERARAGLALAEARQAEAAQAQAQAVAERARLEARLAAADARIAEQQDLAERLAASERAFSERERSQAQLALASLRAERAALAAEAPGLEAAVERAQAGERMAQAEQAVAVSALRQAELDLERSAVRSPIAGVVQNLHVHVGSSLMPRGDMPKAASVAELYDPARLQARIDVPLADAAGLVPGQAVSLQCEALPDSTIAGRVERIVGEADIARNTLQAKVVLEQPHPLLRPGMLLRARFHALGAAGPAPTVGGGQQHGLRLVLPRAVPGAEPGTSLVCWVVGEGERVQRREVRLGQAVGAEGVEVLEGLAAGALVVLDPPPGLAEGDRIAIAELLP